jgi:hypothetical protein
MAANRHPHKDHKADQDRRDRELDAWLHKAMGMPKPDPEPVLRDL